MYLATVLPRVGIAVLAHALVVEAVHLCDLPRLVVTAQQRHLLWVLGLEDEQLRERLEAVVAAVDKVAHENVVGLGRVAARAEQLLQVVVLTVDVTAHGHGRAHRLHVALLDQILEHEVAEPLELVLGQVLAVTGHLEPSIHVVATATTAATAF